MSQSTSTAVAAPLLRRWNSRSWAAAAGYIVLYVLCDWLSYVQPVLKLGITPWNPQAGLTLIFLLIVGPQWLGCTAIASLLAELWVRDASPASPLVLAASVWIAVGYGALAALLRRWQLDRSIRTSTAAAKLAGACLGGTIVIAVGYVVLFVANGVLPREHALRALPKLLIGDLTGVLTLTPLMVNTRPWGAALALMREHRWRLLVQLAVLVLSVWIIFGMPVTVQLRFFYLAFVPVIWISLRWGLPGGLLATLIIQIGLIVAVQGETPSPPLLDLQFLMLTLSLTALLLGAAVTERADVLQRVAMREAEQRALLTMSPDGVLVIDARGLVHMANPAALELFGAGSGLPPAASLREWLPELSLQEPAGRETLQGRRVDGERFPADIAWARLDTPAANAGFLVTVRDATDRLRAEEQARERDAGVARAMRFAVAGELASALAHELNQPITALVSYLRASDILAAPFGRGNERLKATLGKAAQEAMRASEVLRRLRDFYRSGTLKREPVHLPTLCGSVAMAFQDRLRRSNASLVTHMGGPLPMPEADAMQLEIVLHNLLANAVEAVSHSSKPWRRIELHVYGDAREVFLRIEDCGPGVAPELAGRLFEPFVTNKPDGMGLGLAISRSFIRASGGELTFAPSSRLGGACFIVRIPTREPSEPLR